MSAQSIRIIGGIFKGKKIPVAKLASLRPTPNRVRETLFNWIQFDIHHWHTLELFSGTGALSFEALSRGAKSVTLVEQNPSVFDMLKKTSLSLSAKNCALYHESALSFIQKHDLSTFDLIFLDPPFNSSLLTETLHILTSKINPNCLLYIESNQKIDVEALKLTILKEKKASQVFYGLYRI